MEERSDAFLKAVFFFFSGVALASLFVWSVLQGILIHLSGNIYLAFPYYFMGWFAGVGGITLYWQAKKLFYFADISK